MRYYRPDPYEAMVRLRERISQLLADAEGRGGRQPAAAVAAWAPRVNIVETADGIIVTADLCGLDQEQIEVEITGDTLTISGERPPDFEASERVHRLERRFGRFARSFAIGPDIEPENAHAGLSDGVLTLAVPKIREKLPTEIKVNVE